MRNPKNPNGIEDPKEKSCAPAELTNTCFFSPQIEQADAFCRAQSTSVWVRPKYWGVLGKN